MREFDHRPLTAITSSDVARFLARLDAEPSMGPRTVNKHRQVLASVFAHAMRVDTFGLAVNPVAATDKRREPDDRPIEFYEPEEVIALAAAARDGHHRDPRRPAVTPEEVAERRRADEQDATLFLVAASTGLRLGELLALRWRHVHFPGREARRRGELVRRSADVAEVAQVARCPAGRPARCRARAPRRA